MGLFVAINKAGTQELNLNYIVGRGVGNDRHYVETLFEIRVCLASQRPVPRNMTSI